MSEKLVIETSSTALGYTHCIKAFSNTVVSGYWQPNGSSAIYGVALHKYVDTMFRTNSNFRKASDAALKVFQVQKVSEDKYPWLDNHKHMLSTCFNTWTGYISEDKSFDRIIIKVKCFDCNGTGLIPVSETSGICNTCQGKGLIDGPATEVTFRIKIYEDDHIIVYLNGTIDSLGQIRNGCFAIGDFKTTKSWNKKEFLERFRLSRQLRVYVLACKLESQNHPDSILGKIGATRMGAFIDGIFLKPNSNDTEYQRSEVYQFREDDIAGTHKMILDFCKKLSDAIRLNYFPKEGILHGTCIQYNKECKFAAICANNETLGQVLLNKYFVKKKYDPLHYND